MGAPAPEAPAAAPGGGAVAPGGGASAQTVQQIMMLLTQLGQEEPDPQIQHLVQQAMQPLQALETAMGKDDEGDAMSGLHNPGGPGGGEEAEPGGAPGGPAGGAMPGGEPGGGEHHVVEVHIGVPSKSFGGAKKEAMDNFKEKGHFSRSAPKGAPPQTERTKNKAKG